MVVLVFLVQFLRNINVLTPNFWCHGCCVYYPQL